MKDWIKSDRLSFSFGSLEWMIFFGVPTGLLILGLINLFFVFKVDAKEKFIVFLIGALCCFVVGVLTYFLQSNRLKYKSINLVKELDKFKAELRESLILQDWEIDYDNKLYLQATYRGSLLNLDMLTLYFTKNEIRWNVIRHPQSHNSIAALLTFNKEGKKMIAVIKASA